MRKDKNTGGFYPLQMNNYQPYDFMNEKNLGGMERGMESYSQNNHFQNSVKNIKVVLKKFQDDEKAE